MEEVKAGKRKLFGYGHRTYKGMDPRVRPIQSILKDLTHVDQPLLKVLRLLRRRPRRMSTFFLGGCIPMLTFMGTSCSLGCEYKLLWIHCLELSDELLFQRL